MKVVDIRTHQGRTEEELRQEFVTQVLAYAKTLAAVREQLLRVLKEDERQGGEEG